MSKRQDDWQEIINIDLPVWNPKYGDGYLLGDDDLEKRHKELDEAMKGNSTRDNQFYLP